MNEIPPLAKKRSAAIDMIKGLSIMTLFFLHFENGCFNFDKNYFLVRSPAFYMVVGWLWGISSHQRTVAEHWSKRKVGLVRPYICFSCIFLILDIILILFGWIDPFILWRDLYKTLCLRGIGTLWFLPALLGGEMIFLMTRDRPWKLKIPLYVLILVFVTIYEHEIVRDFAYKDIINAPLRVVIDFCNSFIYLSSAYYLSRSYGKKILSMNKVIMFALGYALLSIGFFLFNYSSFQYPVSTAVFILFNIIVGYGIILLFTSIENFKPISRPLVYCGKNSLIIMVVHYCLLLEMARLFDRLVLKHDTLYGQRSMIYFTIALVLQVIIIEIINKKFRYIIGK